MEYDYARTGLGPEGTFGFRLPGWDGALRWTAGDPRLASSITIAGPSGENVAVHAAGRHVTSTATTAAGVYRVRSGAAERTFVVNPTTETESDLSAPVVPPSSEPAVIEQRPGDPGSSRAFAVNNQRSAISVLLLAALSLLVLEWHYSSRGVS